jgi:hypothetical protein
MSLRKPRIHGTPARTSYQIPKCKQCIKEDLGDPTRHVVRFMGGWACRIHFKVQNEKAGEQLASQLNPGVPINWQIKPSWTLRELFPNRAHRRQADRRSRATRGVGAAA